MRDDVPTTGGPHKKDIRNLDSSGRPLRTSDTDSGKPGPRSAAVAGFQCRSAGRLVMRTSVARPGPLLRPSRQDHVPLRCRSVTPLRGTFLRWRRLPWWAEIATIAVGYLLYEATRSTAPTHRLVAAQHANVINNIERITHLDPERTLNGFLAMHSHLGLIAGYYYGTLHFIVTPVLLVVLWRRWPSSYPALRSALVIASISSLAVYWLYPVTPPRLIGMGFHDTLASQHILNAGSGAHGPTGFVNLYAALPSLHVGWAFWCALAVVKVGRSRWRFTALLYPLATTLVVVATANHYLFDAFAGMLVVGLSLSVTHVRIGEARTRLVAGRAPLTVPRGYVDTAALGARAPSNACSRSR